LILDLATRPTLIALNPKKKTNPKIQTIMALNKIIIFFIPEFSSNYYITFIIM
jgi:hypothetical protein